MTDSKNDNVVQDNAVLANTPAPVVAETKVVVSRTVKLDGVDVDSGVSEETIEVQTFVTTPAMAIVSVPVKLSRQFQSIGVEVGVYLPCYKEELSDAIELAYRMVKERVAREIPLIKSGLESVTQ